MVGASETQREIAAGENGAERWRAAHEQLLCCARDRAGLDFEEGQQMLAALRAGSHLRFGYGSFAEYIERLFGYAPRLTREKLRVAQALETLPSARQSLRAGTTSWSALRELTRVATLETEGAWLEAARGKSVRDIERLVSGHRLGSRPDDAVEPEAQRHVLRFEVSGEAMATFREAMARLRQDTGGSLDDDQALLLMARHVLGGPSDDGRASYQVALSLCPKCQAARQQGCGELIPIGTATAAAARCDAQYLPADDVVESDGRAHLESAAFAGGQPDRYPLSKSRPHVGRERLVPGAGIGTSGGSARASRDRPRVIEHAMASTLELAPGDRLVPSSDMASQPDDVGGSGGLGAAEVSVAQAASTKTPRRRATQTIPPALRRQILRRDRHCCRFPGCRQTTFVDLHHIETRAEGGTHEPGNLITVCGAHHRALHRGEVILEGCAANGLRFRHADGTVYGGSVSAPIADLRAQAFRGLRTLGFGDGQARRALDQSLSDPENVASLELLLRRALETLVGSRTGRAA